MPSKNKSRSRKSLRKSKRSVRKSRKTGGGLDIRDISETTDMILSKFTQFSDDFQLAPLEMPTAEFTKMYNRLSNYKMYLIDISSEKENGVYSEFIQKCIYRLNKRLEAISTMKQYIQAIRREV